MKLDEAAKTERILEGLGGATLFSGAAAIVVVLGAGIFLWLRRWRLVERI